MAAMRRVEAADVDEDAVDPVRSQTRWTIVREAAGKDGVVWGRDSAVMVLPNVFAQIGKPDLLRRLLHRW